jgi:hypothetical protein
MEKTSRRAFVGGAVVAGAAASAGATPDVAGAAATATRRLTVEVAIKAFDSIRQPVPPEKFPTGPYATNGDIYPNGTLGKDGSVPAGAKSVGTYRCFGWIYDGATGHNMTQQTFAFNKGGEIDLIGREPGPAAIGGGTGNYRNSRGSARIDEISDTAIRATFRIIG